ncbi:MAG: NACHT domain-containing protein [Myxococcaceae bacterium]|nr:MAG: NACHT domain-containing protein [Myxococcaceae bacterium]
MTIGADILLGIGANALYSALLSGGRKASEVLDSEVLSVAVKSNASLKKFLRIAIGQIASVTSADPFLQERVESFLKSPDVVELARLSYMGSMSVSGAAERGSAEALFVETFVRHVGKDTPALRSFAKSLHGTISSLCDRTLRIAAEHGASSAKQALSSKRHSVVLAEISDIQRKLERLQHSASRVADLDAVELRYREEAAQHFSKITPPHADSQWKVSIDRIYVTPQFHPVVISGKPRQLPLKGFDAGLVPDGQGRVVTLSSEQIRLGIHRSVVLGNPGGGKTTFARKVCHELSTRYSERLVGHRLLTPVLVVLREYGAWRQTQPRLISKFIADCCMLQIETQVSAIDLLLSKGRLLVVFDGLDELIDTSTRREIRDDVESFCRVFPSTPVLVTSREVGYEQAPLAPDGFEVFRIGSLAPEQVQEYASKWFGLDEDLEPRVRDANVVGFMRDSAPVSDLRSNPLMLGLMCSLYVGEGYIPHNRSDVYEKCASHLFEKWDRSRGIRVDLRSEYHLRPAIENLALWIYRDKGFVGGVTETSLVRKTSDYLSDGRIEDSAEAGCVAREFVEYCRGRAWVFSDTGTTPDGESLYQFSHRTFLEYFAAAHLARTYETPSDLAKMLVPKIREREWDMVAQLAFQIQSRNLGSAASRLLEFLLAAAGSVDLAERGAILSFATRSLSFLVPGAKTVREVIEGALEYCVDYRRARIVENGSPAQHRRTKGGALQAGEMIVAVLSVRKENRRVVVKSFVDFMSIQLSGPDVERAACATTIFGHLDDVDSNESDREGGEVFEEVATVVRSSVVERELILAPHSVDVALGGFFRGWVSLEMLVGWYGVASVFANVFSRVVEVIYVSPASSLIMAVLGAGSTEGESESRASLLRDLEYCGQILMQSPRPWVRSSQGVFIPSPLIVFASGRASTVAWTRRALVGIVLLLAYQVDADRSKSTLSELRSMKLSPELMAVREIVSAWTSRDEARLAAPFESLGFEPEVRAFLTRWVSHEERLVIPD